MCSTNNCTNYNYENHPSFLAEALSVAEGAEHVDAAAQQHECTTDDTLLSA